MTRYMMKKVNDQRCHCNLSLTNASCSFYSLQVNMFVWLPRKRWHAWRTFRGKIKQSFTNDGFNYWSLQHNDMGYVFSHIYLHFDKDRHLSISNILNWLLQLVVLGKIFPVIWKSDNWNPNYTIQCTVIRNIKQQNTSCSGILRIEINKWFWPLSNWPWVRTRT